MTTDQASGGAPKAAAESTPYAASLTGYQIIPPAPRSLSALASSRHPSYSLFIILTAHYPIITSIIAHRSLFLAHSKEVFYGS
jgi:hypothetical protein